MLRDFHLRWLGMSSSQLVFIGSTDPPCSDQTVHLNLRVALFLWNGSRIAHNDDSKSCSGERQGIKNSCIDRTRSSRPLRVRPGVSEVSPSSGCRSVGIDPPHVFFHPLPSIRSRRNHTSLRSERQHSFLCKFRQTELLTRYQVSGI